MAVPPILAATFTVAFQGLMMFQGDGNGNHTHVAIVNATCYYKHDDPFVEVWRPRTPGGALSLVSHIPLEAGDDVSFGVQGTVTASDGYFSQFVPKVTAFVVQGKVDGHVLKSVTMPHDDAVLAFVTLPPGDLTTFGTFNEKVQLASTGTKYCFTRYVILQAQTGAMPASLAIHHTNSLAVPLPIEIKSDDLVIVSNSSMDQRHVHLPAYSRLLDKDGTLGAIKIISEACTDHPLTVTPAVRDVLDGTQDPHGDCGPIDNP
jgi:hypothetical protein